MDEQKIRPFSIFTERWKDDLFYNAAINQNELKAVDKTLASYTAN